MLRQSIDTEALRKEFDEKKIVTIPDFLAAQPAEKLYTFLNSGIPDDWWFATFYPAPQGGSESVRNFPANQDVIRQKSEAALEVFKRGEFSYSFFRTIGNHVHNCPCIECEFRSFLKSQDVFSKLSTITGHTITATGEIFSSCYRQGNFLSPHSDKDKGKIGFIFNLAKDWKPQYGGNLHMMDQDWVTVNRIITPKFNNLVLFDIPSHNGVPHFVSHISPGVDRKRIAMGGWFN